MSETYIAHNFESLFDIQESTTLLDIPQTNIVENSECPLYDQKDDEIEQQFQSIYEAALNAYDNQIMMVERGISDPSNNHKTLDVANNFLKTALDSVKAKADLKKNKERNVNIKNVDNRSINNNIIMDRNELLKMMLQNG
jgi:hypothetical protein